MMSIANGFRSAGSAPYSEGNNEKIGDKHNMTVDFPEQDEDETSYMTTDVAEKLDILIRKTADELQDAQEAVDEHWAELKRLVDEAKSGNIHELLGFKSWPAYLVDAIGLTEGKDTSNIEERYRAVEFLVSEGLSQRAIAKMLKVGLGTVNRSIAKLIHDGTLEDIQASVGLDGRTRPGAKTGQRDRTTAELTPSLRYQKSYDELDMGISVLTDRIKKDREFASEAKKNLPSLVQLRDELSRAIAVIRKHKLGEPE